MTGDFELSIKVKTPGGRELEFEARTGPRLGAQVVHLMTEIISKGDLASCPGCDLIGEHHLSCLFMDGHPCNSDGCELTIDPLKGVERSGWFYCGASHADADTTRRLAGLRLEHTPRERWCSHDLDAGTYRGPGST